MDDTSYVLNIFWLRQQTTLKYFIYVTYNTKSQSLMDEKQNLFKRICKNIELTPSPSEPFNMPSKDDALFILHFLIFLWHIKPSTIVFQEKRYF